MEPTTPALHCAITSAGLLTMNRGDPITGNLIFCSTGGKGARFGLYVHHTDTEREFAYDRKSSVGRLDRGLDEAPKRGWTIVDMKADWKTIYPESGK